MTGTSFTASGRVPNTVAIEIGACCIVGRALVALFSLVTFS